jgi:hypothetical protein
VDFNNNFGGRIFFGVGLQFIKHNIILTKVPNFFRVVNSMKDLQCVYVCVYKGGGLFF